MSSNQDGHDPAELPPHMAAVQLTGHGGPEKLVYRQDVPVPEPAAGQVLIRVGAAGVNNTDINTRTGWYSKSVTSDTASAGDDSVDDDADAADAVSEDGSWSGTGLDFPRIQGADIAGTVVAVGPGVAADRIGQRVMVRTMQAARDDAGVASSTACVTVGSEMDGGFAQFVAMSSSEALAVDSPLSDVELASFPCAYSTAEGMLHRVGLAEGETVLITGASGGVGSAAVQLAKRRGAIVVAVASAAKWDDVAALGADHLIDRNADLPSAISQLSGAGASLSVGSLSGDDPGPAADVAADVVVDVVVDVVAGPNWPALLEVLRLQGRYVTAGAIAGPIVELDVRTLYLKDLTLMGCTYQPDVVFENLIGYIERGEITPVVSATYPLADIATAQSDFLDKRFTGKLVLIPPTDGPRVSG